MFQIIVANSILLRVLVYLKHFIKVWEGKKFYSQRFTDMIINAFRVKQILKYALRVNYSSS